MTVDELLRKAYQFIHKDEARLLLSILMDYDTLELNLHLDEVVDSEIEKKFKDAVILLKQGKPLQYVLSNAPFYGYDFYVNKSVLIPRFDTEVLVEEANKLITKKFSKAKVLDLCTGSGCIGITLKLLNDNLDVTLVDISKDALEVAKENMELNNISCNLIESDMWSNIDGKFDIIVSNPPYIREDEEIEDIVKENEPSIALYGGKDGLDFYRIIRNGIEEHINDKFLLALEIGDLQATDVTNIFSDIKGVKIICKKDIEGRDRMIFVTRF